MMSYRHLNPMCAVFQFKNKTCKPGTELVARAEAGIVRHVWAGFARNEILGWWQRKGGVLLDIYADRFAERSDKTGQLIWDAVPNRFVIRGLLDTQSDTPLIKIVTRESTGEELLRFAHPRMPVLEPPLFEMLDLPSESSGQSELF